MNLFARILSHGFAIAIVLLLAIGLIYRGDLFPDAELPAFLSLGTPTERGESDSADSEKPELPANESAVPRIPAPAVTGAYEPAAATPSPGDEPTEETVALEEPAAPVEPAALEEPAAPITVPVVPEVPAASLEPAVPEEPPVPIIEPVVPEEPAASLEPAAPVEAVVPMTADRPVFVAEPAAPEATVPAVDAVTEAVEPAALAAPAADMAMPAAAPPALDVSDEPEAETLDTFPRAAVPEAADVQPAPAVAPEVPSAVTTIVPEPAEAAPAAAPETTIPGMTGSTADSAIADTVTSPASGDASPDTLAAPLQAPASAASDLPTQQATEPVAPVTAAPQPEWSAPPAQSSAAPAGENAYQILAAAREAYWLRDYATAESKYRQLTVMEPDNPDGFGELGNMYFSQGMWEQAASAYFDAGIRLVKEGELEQALQLVDVIRGLDGTQADELDRQITAAQAAAN